MMSVEEDYRASFDQGPEFDPDRDLILVIPPMPGYAPEEAKAVRMVAHEVAMRLAAEKGINVLVR